MAGGLRAKVAKRPNSHPRGAERSSCSSTPMERDFAHVVRTKITTPYSRQRESDLESDEKGGRGNPTTNKDRCRILWSSEVHVVWRISRESSISPSNSHPKSCCRVSVRRSEFVPQSGRSHPRTRPSDLPTPGRTFPLLARAVQCESADGANRLTTIAGTE